MSTYEISGGRIVLRQPDGTLRDFGPAPRDGKDGRGFKAPSQPNPTTLRLTMDDGTSYDLTLQPGPAGTPGSVFRSGTGAPANTLGVDGDQYHDTASGNVYTKAAGSYSVTANIRGSAGPAGVGAGGLTVTPASLGLQIPYLAGGDPHWSLGYKVMRIWGGTTTWRQIESNTTKGTYTWTRHDALWTAAKANGARCITTLGQPPDYATGGSAGGPLASGGQYNNKPASVQDFSDYVTAIGTRAFSKFGPGMIWELGNEVQPPGQNGNFWDGPVSTLVAYAQAAKTILKGIDPTCVILTPSVTASTSYINPTMEAMFAGGIGQYVDGVAVHGYVTPDQPETIIPYLRNYRAAAAKYGYGNLPFYDTESTYASWKEVPGGPEKSITGGNTMSTQQRVAYLLRRLLSGLAAGYTVQCEYGAEYSTTDNFAALNLWGSDGTLNAAGTAYQSFLTIMNGARIIEFQSRPRGVFALSVVLADGTPGVWLWTGDGVTVPFPVSAAQDLAVKVDASGTKSTVGQLGTSETIGNIPMLYLSANTAVKAVNVTNVLNAIEQPTTPLLTAALWTGAAAGAGVTTNYGTLASYSAGNPMLPTAAACWTFTPSAGYPQLNMAVTPTLLQPGKRHRLWVEVELLTAAPWVFRLLDTNNTRVLEGQFSGGTFTVPVTGPGIRRVVADFDYPVTAAAAQSDLKLQLFLNSTSNTTPISGCRAGIEIVNESIATITGPAGPAGPNPFLVTGLTGGTNNRLVYVAADGVTCRDAHVSLIDELGFSNLLWKDNSGQYWQPGATITEAGPLTPGYVRAMQPQTGAAVANYRDIDQKAGQPADLAPTPNQVYVEFGKIWTSTTWKFKEPQVDGVATAPVNRYDSLLVANYPRGSAVPAGRFGTTRWASYTGSTVFNSSGNSAPHGAMLEFQGGGSYGRRFASDEVTGSFADGQCQMVANISAGGNEFGQVLRGQGTPAAPTGLVFNVSTSNGAGNVRIYTLVAGTETTLVSSTVAVSTTGWRMRFEAEGTLVRAKIWNAANAEPSDWTLTTYQVAVTGPGYAGGYSTYGSLQIGSWSTVVGKGADAALTGNT